MTAKWNLCMPKRFSYVRDAAVGETVGNDIAIGNDVVVMEGDDLTCTLMSHKDFEDRYADYGTFMSSVEEGMIKDADEEVDDIVDAWHGADPPTGVELHEFLGMSIDEYGLYVAGVSVVTIAGNRKKEQSP